MSLEETKARLLTASKTTEDLLALVNDLYVRELHSEESILTEALSELHNSGELDLVKILSGVDKSSCGNNFFRILHSFENVLPSLDARTEDVLQALSYLTQLADRDLAASGVYGAFELFCRVDMNRPRDSVEFILKQSDLNIYASFLSSAILAYDSSHVVEAIQIIKDLIANSSNTVRSQAYFALGQLSVCETHANIIWKLLSDSGDSERDSDCCALVLRSAIHFGEKFPSYWPQIDEFLITFVEGASANVLYTISNIVAFQRSDLPASILHLLVKQLANVSIEHKGTIDNIDHLLVKLVERGSSSLAIELLESILVTGVGIISLDHFSYELLSKHQELLNYIITKWFLYGEASLCRSVLDLLIHDATEKNIELKAEMTLLGDEVKKVFVCHKAIGWLFTQPKMAADFILSISDIASSTTLEEIERILYDPLLLSYPGELTQFFQSCIDTGVHKHLCERLLRRIKSYHAELEIISGLKELMAPNENISAYWKDFEKDMQKSQETASKSSFVSMVSKTQVLLYGNSSIYYSYQVDGTSVRQEMQMHSFYHSTEMPRLNVLDPESLDYILRIYRCERMKNEINS